MLRPWPHSENNFIQEKKSTVSQMSKNPVISRECTPLCRKFRFLTIEFKEILNLDSRKFLQFDGKSTYIKVTFLIEKLANHHVAGTPI